MQSITIRQGQSISDLAIQHCGSMEACMQICDSNNISLTGLLEVNKNLNIIEIKEKKVVELLQRQGTIPATAKNELNILQGGIGYMQIGTTFIVS